MRRLVALDLAGGPTFVDALRRALDAGDAVWPVDQRLKGPARERSFAAIAPTDVVRPDGERRTLFRGHLVEQGDALVIATSGTTGEPRGVVLTMDALSASAIATSTRLGVDSATDHWLCCLPLSHIGGFSVVARALLTNTPLTVHAGFDKAAVEAAASSHATLVSLVSTALLRLDPKIAMRFRTIVLGGSAPPASLAANVVTTYGLSETGSGVVYNGEPLAGVELRIDEGGEIFLRGPMLAATYRDGAPVTDGDGWLATGDCGKLDPRGRLEIDGRLKELIVSGGENVWPAAVERVIVSHQGIAEVGVVGVADPEWGERVVAGIVLEARASAPSLEDLRELVGAELGPFAAPKDLVVFDALPKTSIGKLRRRELALLLSKRLQR